MLRANQVMTRAVAAVTPQTPVSQVATMMRDLNIGDILVLQDGKLRGIVTDRDLTINVLTNGANADAPIERYMTTEVVTGSPDWSLEKIAGVMGKHQVRRLPIVQEDTVVGIVSLGDVAVHTSKSAKVSESLKKISETTRTRFKRAQPLTKVLTLAIPVAFAAGVLLFGNSNSGRRVRKQLSESELAEQARVTVYDAVQALQNPKTRQAAVDALEGTGLPEKTRSVIQEGIRVLQNSGTRANQAANEWSHDGTERVGRLAAHAHEVPNGIAHRLQKPKPKRFIFV